MGLSSTMTLSKHFYTEVVYNDQGEKLQMRWRKIHQDTFEYLVSMRGLNLLSSNDQVGEELTQSGVNVTCRMCFWGESQGSERARRMLSCKSCGKKYHKNCVKSWAQHRGTFI
uniref:RING-type domain-containing protein n=1 Tax=Brassica campestris TaxID=3711 RepID=M4ECH0_BRACM